MNLLYRFTRQHKTCTYSESRVQRHDNSARWSSKLSISIWSLHSIENYNTIVGMSVIGLKFKDLLLVEDEYGSLTTGGDQHWFPKEGFIPPGACGATTASNVLAYLLRSRKELYEKAANAGLEGLAAPVDIRHANILPNKKRDFIEFMKKVYRFTYPRIGGLMADAFLEGISGLSEEYRLHITVERLIVPIARSKRPSFVESAEFLMSSLEAELPVAFLILSNGCVEGLDTWHWVTILALDEEGKRVQIADNGNVFWADIETWLDTSIMGGSFVSLRPGVSGKYSPE